MNRIPGLHHVTAIATDAQANADFYVSLLGLRLVKRTVNFDDPATYHLYYGDEAGTPGTILTFFPWPGAPRGARGTGETTATAFAVPPGSLEWWMDRLAGAAIAFGSIEERFGERVLALRDPDDLVIELIEHAGSLERSWWKDGPVPGQRAVRGFHSVTLTEDSRERTSATLTEAMGYGPGGEEGARIRFTSGEDAAGAAVDVLLTPGARAGRIAAGSVHHIAFRCDSDEAQIEWQRRLSAAGLRVTPVQDREYFHSIYFREPGGVLFEIATDPPGFARDEAPEALGSALKLPPWLEPKRGYIEQRLPPLRLPAIARAT